MTSGWKSTFGFGVLLTISTLFRRSQGFDTNQWLLAKSAFGAHEQTGSSGDVTYAKDDDDDDDELGSIIVDGWITGCEYNEPCPPGYHFGYQCQCVKGYEPPPGPGPVMYPDGNCSPCPMCYWQNGRILTLKGQRYYSPNNAQSHGESQVCPQGQFLMENGECAPFRQIFQSCPPGQQRSPNGQCVLNPHHRPFSPEEACPPGQFRRKNGQCTPIPQYRSYIPQRACPPGLKRLPNGQCAPIPQHRSYIPQEACPLGLRLPNGQCTISQYNSYISQEACPPGLQRLPDGHCAPDPRYHSHIPQEACPPGLQRLSDGQCAPIPLPQASSPESICPSGQQQLPDGQCAPIPQSSSSGVCPPGQARAGPLLQCAPVLTNRSLEKCPDGSQPGPDGSCSRQPVDQNARSLRSKRSHHTPKFSSRRAQIPIWKGRGRYHSRALQPRSRAAYRQFGS